MYKRQVEALLQKIIDHPAGLSQINLTILQGCLLYTSENLTEPERYAKAISAGTDVIGGNTDPENIVKAVEDGLLPKADLDRASYNRLLSLFRCV